MRGADSSKSDGATATKPTLIGVPYGNNPSRARMLIYHKGIEAEFDLKTPADYGGLAADAYRALNPQGKMPVLLLGSGEALYEARVITGYILDAYAGTGPSMIPTSAKLRARAQQIIAVHDLYIASPNSLHPSVTSNQGCAYKSVEQVDAPNRSRKLSEVATQLEVLEGLIIGPYAVGDEPTEADMTLYPTLGVLLPYLVDRVFGWPCLLSSADHPKLSAWLATVEQLPAALRIKQEMLPGLHEWESSGRFDPIRAQIKAAPELPWSRDQLVSKARGA